MTAFWSLAQAELLPSSGQIRGLTNGMETGGLGQETRDVDAFGQQKRQG